MESLASSRTGRQFQRYYDGCRQVVGCIPYRFKKNHHQSHLHQGSLIENLEVLLISSPKAHHLFFPKGGWEIDETMEEAARRETQEEAGVVGILEHQLGKWRFKSKSQGTFHDAYMFPLFVQEQLDVWPEKDVRRRIWMSIKEAREVCSHLWMKEALDEFVHRLTHSPRPKEEENRTPCASLEVPCGVISVRKLFGAHHGVHHLARLTPITKCHALCCLLNWLYPHHQSQSPWETTTWGMEWYSWLQGTTKQCIVSTT